MYQMLEVLAFCNLEKDLFAMSVMYVKINVIIVSQENEINND